MTIWSLWPWLCISQLYRKAASVRLMGNFLKYAALPLCCEYTRCCALLVNTIPIAFRLLPSHRLTYWPDLTSDRFPSLQVITKESLLAAQVGACCIHWIGSLDLCFGVSCISTYVVFNFVEFLSVNLFLTSDRQTTHIVIVLSVF